MVEASQIKEHTEVVGSDGGHVGTVDHMEGSDQIKLTRRDPAAAGQHHFIPLAWVASADDDRVTLNKTADEARNQWKSDADAGEQSGGGGGGNGTSSSSNNAGTGSM